jgi:transcriptional regulator with XRE-family HTH domain
MNTSPEMKHTPIPGARIIDRICHLLEEGGHSQLWLARKVGIRENRISKWRAGLGEPRAAQLYLIARTLGVPMESLVDDGAGGEPPEGR